MQITKILSILILSSLFIIGCTDEDENAPALGEALNNQPLGSASRDLLTDDNYTSLTIEMISVRGYEPTKTAIQEFRKFLETHLQKPDGIYIHQRSVSSPGLTTFSIEDIRNIESANRSLYTQGDEITVYVYFADGGSVKDTDTNITLGTSYLNTSLVIYEKTLRTLARQVDAPRLSTIETAALNHEFAHLLGLVNTGTTSSSETNSPSDGHCNVDGCLMEATIQFKSGVMDVLGKGVPELDANCLAALEEIKANL